MSRPRIIHTKCGDRTEGFDLLKPQKYITWCPRDLQAFVSYPLTSPVQLAQQVVFLWSYFAPSVLKMATWPITMDFEFILWKSFKMQRVQQWARGRKYHVFPKESQGLILHAAEMCQISWVLSVQHLFRDAQDFTESKLWAIRLSMNINEMLSLYQMEPSDKYSGCQAQKIVNLSHIPWQQQGNLLKTDLCNRNWAAATVGYIIHMVKMLTFNGNYFLLVLCVCLLFLGCI